MNLKSERLRILGYSDLDIEHHEELHRLIAERDAKYPMPWLITQQQYERRKLLRLPNDDFAILGTYKRPKWVKP